MRFKALEFAFILVFIGSVIALQVGYWLERRIIARLRHLTPDQWHRYTYFFAGRLHTRRLKQRMAAGGLRDAELVDLLRTRRRVNLAAVVAFAGAILMVLVGVGR